MFNNKAINCQTYNNNNIIYVIPQNKNNNAMATPENTFTNNKRARNYSSSNICKRRRVSPLSINTVYVQQQRQQQPVIVTNYYKPQQQNEVLLYKQQSKQPQPQQQQKSKSKQQKPIDISNQFKVTQVSEVFQGCSELSLPKFVIYLIYKIWCCCNLSQYRSFPSSIDFNNNGYLSPIGTPNTPNVPSHFSSNLSMNHARIPSPITPSNNYFGNSFTEVSNDKVNALYKNICQSKIFQEQPVMKKRVIKNSDEEDGQSSKKESVSVDPKDLETQILKASSRSCKGELKNNYSKLIDYVDHLLKITQISFSSVILALEYIYRLKEASQSPEGKFLNQWSYEEIIPIAFMMANKYVSDDRYSNTVWANVTNISLKHLNELEMKGLVAISFRLYVSENDYNHWISLIKKVSHDLTCKYEQLRQPTASPSKQIPNVSCNLSSPNPINSKTSFNPTFSSPSSKTSATSVNYSSSNLATPSSNLNTVIYSPMTPSKIQHVTGSAIATSQKTQMINIIPKSQILPAIPVTRVFKAQSQPAFISIPTSRRLSVPVQFHGCTASVIPKVQAPSNVVFFQKLNTTNAKTLTTKLQLQQPVARQNVCIYPSKKNTIYPSPPLSRTTSLNSDFILYQNGKTNNMKFVVPSYVKSYHQPTTQPIMNPFIQGFQF
jgi:hypothetical protein